MYPLFINGCHTWFSGSGEEKTVLYEALGKNDKKEQLNGLL
jgi:hypothetical protein